MVVFLLLLLLRVSFPSLFVGGCPVLWLTCRSCLLTFFSSFSRQRKTKQGLEREMKSRVFSRQHELPSLPPSLTPYQKALLSLSISFVSSARLIAFTTLCPPAAVRKSSVLHQGKQPSQQTHGLSHCLGWTYCPGSHSHHSPLPTR